MVRNLAAGVAGIVFGLGLAVSGMTDPAKVLGFLDVAGAWDPSLILVMGGVVVAFFAFSVIYGRGRDRVPPRPRPALRGRLATGVAARAVP